MTLTTGERVPKYRKVYATLREYIEAGRWPEGSLLPTEAETAQLFSVSRITVREALQILESEGYISRKRGRGTVVKSIAPLPASCFVSFTDQMLREGIRSTPAFSTYGCSTQTRPTPRRSTAASAWCWSSACASSTRRRA